MLQLLSPCLGCCNDDAFASSAAAAGALLRLLHLRAVADALLSAVAVAKRLAMDVAAADASLQLPQH